MNAFQRRWAAGLMIAGGIAAVVAAGALVLRPAGAPSAVTIATAEPSATQTTRPPVGTYGSDFGYTVELPVGWRRSDLLSSRIPGTGFQVGHDLYTRRTAEDE